METAVIGNPLGIFIVAFHPDDCCLIDEQFQCFVWEARTAMREKHSTHWDMLVIGK